MSDQRQQLNEMKQFMKISEGSWQLPRTKEDFDKLHDILTSDDNNFTIQDRIYNVIGDDTLLDLLGKLDPQGSDAAETITRWMQDQRTDKHSNFPNIWNTYKLSQRHDSPMNETFSSDYSDVDVVELEVGDQLLYVPDGFTTKVLRIADSYAVIEDDVGQEIKVSFAELESDDYKKATGYELEEGRDRAREWTSRSFNAIGPPNGPWRVEDRLAIRDNIVAGPYDDEEEAWAVADEMQAGKNKKESDWYKRGNKGMWGGDVHMNSNLDEDDAEEFKRDLQNPQWRERRAGEIKRHGEYFSPNKQTGKTKEDNLFMARVLTPKGKGTVYSVNNLTPTDPSFPHPTVSVRLDSDPGGYGGGQQQHRFKLSDVEILPYDEMGEVNEVGEVKHDDYGATPVYEDDDECTRCCGLGRHPAGGKDCPECHGTGTCPKLKEGMLKRKMEDDAYTMSREEFTKEYGKWNGEFWDNINESVGKSISLGDIVENVLQEYPGQPKDYDEGDYDPDEADQREMAYDMGSDYNSEEIDPEYEDSELGYRFD